MMRLTSLASFVVVVVVVGAVGGCDLDLTVPAGTVVNCDDNSDCPAPQVCATRVNRCVDPARIDDPAITIVEATLTSSRMSRVPPFDENGVVVRTAFAPARLDVRFAGNALACVADADDKAVARCAFFTPDDAVDADLAVTVEAHDDLGNIASDTLPVTIDVTAPALLPATVVSRLLAAADNPRAIDGVDAARAGTTVEVGFAFNEPCATPPIVTASSAGGARVELSNDDDIALPALAFFVRRDITDTDTDGVYDLAAGCADAVGNVVEGSAAGVFVVDNTRPAVIDVDSAHGADVGVVLARAPWGVAVDGGFSAPVARVSGTVTDRDDVANLRVDVYAPALVGSGAVDVDGHFDIALLIGDARAAAVEVVDGAGNVSARVVVRNVVWTATFGGKVVGSTFENPHTLRATSSLKPALEAPARELDPAAVFGHDVDDRDAAVSGLAWRELSLPRNRPQARLSAPVAFDPIRGVVVMAGGQMNLPSQPFTWLHDGEAWQPLPVTLPAIETSAGVGAYDVRRDRFVVVTSAGAVAEFDGAAWTSGASLPTRALDGAFAWDPDLGASVFVTSSGTDGAPTETWAWDGAWRQLPGPGPSPRLDPTLAWDDSLRGLVLFGGRVGSVALHDTWLFADGAWQQLDVEGPAVDIDSILVAGPDGGVVLIGSIFADSQRDDLFHFIDGAWSRIDIVGAERPARLKGASVVSNPHTGEILFFGGLVVPEGSSGSFNVVATTIRFDGTRWRTETVAPSLLTINASGSDDGAGKSIVFGGSRVFNGGGVGLSNGIGIFDGRGWRELFFDDAPDVFGHAPLARRGNDIVVVNDPSGRTFSWSPASEQWSSRDDGAPVATNAVFSALGPLTALLIGAGPSSSQTFIYGGRGWSLVCDPARGDTCPVSSPQRRGQLVAARVENDVVALYDGDEGTTQLFADGVWTALRGPQPPARTGPAIARHPGRDSVILFGGGTDTWELRCDTPCTAASARWLQLPTSTSPPPRTTHTLATFGDGVVFSGGATVGDTWILPNDDARPALQARFSLSAAGLAGEVQSVSVDAVAGSAGPGASGLELQGFQAGAYTTLATSTSSASSLSWTTADPLEIENAQLGAPRDVVVVVTTAGGGVVDGVATEVGLDSIELRVRYRLPTP